MENKTNQNNVKIINFLVFLSPVIFALIAIYMKKNLAYQPSPETYEINEAMRIVQYFLYLSGLAVFFFIDAIVNPIRKKFLKQNLPTSPIVFNILGLCILGYISISGFLGFIISGNISWVIIFCAISFFSGIRFLPFKRQIEKFYSSQINN